MVVLERNKLNKTKKCHANVESNSHDFHIDLSGIHFSFTMKQAHKLIIIVNLDSKYKYCSVIY